MILEQRFGPRPTGRRAASRLPLIRCSCGFLVAVLGLVVLVAAYMDVGYSADLGETARRFGDEGTTASLVSFVAGVVLLVLGVVVAATAFMGPAEAAPPRPRGAGPRAPGSRSPR